MSNQIAVGQCSTEEDLDIEWSFASGYDPTGKTFEVLVRERASAAIKTTLTVGSGLTIVGAAVKAKVAKATMAAWARMEYTADLVDKTGSTPKRLVPTRITFDEPGKLVGGVTGNSFRVEMAGNRFVITATRGEAGPVGPATTLTIGTVTDVAPGNPPSANLTGPAGAQVLNLGLVRGTPGSGAPDSPDILAIARRSDLIADLRAIGITETPSLIADFIDDIYYADRSYMGASIAALGVALPGSSIGRGSAASYYDRDGLLKSAAANVVRLDHDPASRRRRGFRCENGATNILANAMLDAGTTLFGATLTAAASAFADGTTRMSRLVNTAANGDLNSSVCDVYPAVADDASAWTFSTFLRQGSSPKSTVCLAFIGGATEVIQNLVIEWSTLTTTGPGQLRDLGGGLFRASVTASNNNSGNTTAICRVYTRENGASHVVGESVDTGGWQMERGVEATSFIETSGSAVARLPDRAVLGIGSWLGPESTILVEFEATPNAKARVPLFVSEVTGAFGAGVYLACFSGDIVIAPNAAPANLNAAAFGIFAQKNRAAMRFRTNNAGISVNGGAVAADTSCTIPTPDGVALGSNYFAHAVGDHLDGHLRRVIVFSAALSDAKLQLLSALSWRTP